ncbi:hypothetical protein Tco_0576104 [Tanacetum coccineum]
MVINSPCLNDKKELAIPEQTATGKESTNPLMADSLPKTIMPTKLVKPQGFNLRPNMVSDHHSLKRVLKHKLNLRSLTKVSTPQDGHLQGSSSEIKESRGQEALN